VKFLIYEELKCIIKKRASLHLEDDFGIQKCWNELIQLLSINETETISCLNLCSEEEFLWVSEVFEDVAYNLKSDKYIMCLKQLAYEYPNLNLENFVKTAEEYHQSVINNL
jgi:hypothetical protein